MARDGHSERLRSGHHEQRWVRGDAVANARWREPYCARLAAVDGNAPTLRRWQAGQWTCSA